APSATRAIAIFRRRGSRIRAEARRPTPNASTARVATTKPNVGTLSSSFFIVCAPLSASQTIAAVQHVSKPPFMFFVNLDHFGQQIHAAWIIMFVGHSCRLSQLFDDDEFVTIGLFNHFSHRRVRRRG